MTEMKEIKLNVVGTYLHNEHFNYLLFQKLDRGTYLHKIE